MRDLILKTMYPLQEVGSARSLWATLPAWERAKHDQEAFVDAFNKLVDLGFIGYQNPDWYAHVRYHLTPLGLNEGAILHATA